MTESIPPTPEYAEPLARITEASSEPGRTLVLVGDLVAVLALLHSTAEERDVLRQMLNR